jgi:hypothetical protein
MGYLRGELLFIRACESDCSTAHLLVVCTCTEAQHVLATSCSTASVNKEREIQF